MKRVIIVVAGIAALLLSHSTTRSQLPPPAGQPADFAMDEQTFWDHADEKAATNDDMIIGANGWHLVHVEDFGESERVTVDGQEHRIFDSVSEKIYFSRGGKRVAYFGKRDGKWIAVLDGKESEPYDWLNEETFKFADQGLFYAARRGESRMLVIDQREGRAYAGSGGNSPMVSANGRRAAMIVYRGDTWQVVIDGVESKEYDAICGAGVVFSPDEKRSAFSARRGNKWLMVIDGVEGKECDWIDDIPVFSPDSRRAAYRTKSNNKWRLVVDNTESEEFDTIDGLPVFSADGQHVAIAALAKPQWFAVVDGQRGTGFTGVDPPIQLAGNPVRCAFVIWRGDKRNVVVDGVEQEKGFDRIDSLAFSPDGKQLIYKGRRGSKWVAVIDGKDGPEYEFVEDLAFGPGGKHVAYTATNSSSKPGGRQTWVVVDAVPGNSYEFVNEFAFSPDGERYAYLGKRDNREMLVVDGSEGKPYGLLFWPVFSPDGKRIACEVHDDGKAQVFVDGKLESDAYQDVSALTFSPDSKHLVYWAHDSGYNGRWRVVVDGRASSGYVGAIGGIYFDSPRTFRAYGYMYSRGSGIRIILLSGRIGLN